MEFDPDEIWAEMAKDSQGPVRHKKVDARHQCIWNSWEQFAQGMGFDPHHIWIDVANRDSKAVSLCKAFLRIFAKKKKERIIVTGPEEYEERPAIKSALTLSTYWTALVREADQRVMVAKRNQDPRNAGHWKLTFSPRDPGYTDKPTYDVGRWIPTLAKEISLNLGQNFEKKDCSSEHVLTLLHTLWARAKDIPCNPKTRVAFHAAVILGAIGGWRPSSLIQVKYKDVEIGWLRDQKTGVVRPVCQILIHHVKQRRDTIKKHQKDRVRFAITTVPSMLICLLRLLTAVAVAQGAFEEGYTSTTQVLERDIPEGCKYVQAHWKKEIEDDCIFNLTYHEFWRVWDRVELVAGLQTKTKTYALRVAAGGRLDGSLTPAVRNFILGHSTGVFETSYQPIDVRVDLMAVSFPTMVGDEINFLSDLRGAFAKRDDRAPLYIDKAEYDQFEERMDITKLREEYKRLSPSTKEAKAIYGKIIHIKNRLERLTILEAREEYFQQANKLHEQGKSAITLQSKATKDHHSRYFASMADVAVHIGKLLASELPQPQLPDVMLSYLRQAPERLDSEPDLGSETSRCLLGCGTFFHRSNLTRHMEKHVFENSFDCPECRQSGRKIEVPAGLEAWSSHIARVHGIQHAPNVHNIKVSCDMCTTKKKFTPKGLQLHQRRLHSEPTLTIKETKDSHKTQSLQVGKAIEKSNEVPVGIKDGDHCKDLQMGNMRKRGCEDESKDLPTKRARTLSPESDTSEGHYSDWRPGSPDSHAGEEFWVTGRDCDFDNRFDSDFDDA